MHEEYQLTIDKLNNIKLSLEKSIQTGDYESSEPDVEMLRHYKDCFYCKVYRKSLQGNESGVCESCLLHKYGERTVGRQLAYNGCYKIVSYRETVRLAWWYRENKNENSAKELIVAIVDTINHMKREENYLLGK